MENKKTNKISSEVNTLNYRLKQKQQTSMKKKTQNRKQTYYYFLSQHVHGEGKTIQQHTYKTKQTSGANRRMKENLTATQKHTNTLEEQTNQKYAFTNTYTLEKQSSFNIIQTHTYTHILDKWKSRVVNKQEYDRKRR